MPLCLVLNFPIEHFLKKYIHSFSHSASKSKVSFYENERHFFVAYYSLNILLKVVKIPAFC